MKTKSGVPSKLLTKSRRVRRMWAESRAAGVLAEFRARRSRHSLRKILILSDKVAFTSEQQLAPLKRYRQTIAAQQGLVFEFDHIDRIATLSTTELEGYAAVGLKLAWNTPPDDAETVAQSLFDTARSAGARSLVFDGDDDQCVLWPGVIEACDAYIKKHRFASLSDYTKSYSGKSNLTDFATREYGMSFDDNLIPRTEPLSEAQTEKIVLGWNIALDDKIFDLAHDLTSDTLSQERTIDIGCRASVAPDKWIYGMRNDAVEAISSLRSAYKVHAPTDRVSQQEYYNEMLRARLTVSPFGYGELCWRDFEAILCGSVLVKQDMSHVTTWPDIFVPHETYVPVAWDFSDLEEVCAPYLEDGEARFQVARNARERLLEALTSSAFVNRLDCVMRKAGIR